MRRGFMLAALAMVATVGLSACSTTRPVAVSETEWSIKGHSMSQIASREYAEEAAAKHCRKMGKTLKVVEATPLCKGRTEYATELRYSCE